uniref:Uncharacterized protein n=1 Tax=Amphilophus citrinellus TaxID=61819 RepID=A0A3Q0TB49_AMPCI
MSSVDVNDENRGVCPGGKHSSTNDIFALDQPTGRPSILRQTENLPNKTVPKGAKVCFQTPRRDPVTKKILSPSKSVNLSSVDEHTKAMDLDKSKQLSSPNKVIFLKLHNYAPQVSSYPDDNMPIQSKGGYMLDFDNLESINPFQGSNKMVLSPARPRSSPNFVMNSYPKCRRAELTCKYCFHCFYSLSLCPDHLLV